MSDERTKITKLSVLKAPSREGQACLVVIYGNDLGRKFDIVDGVQTIGRGTDNGIILDDQEVSRRHCSVSALDNRVTLRDLGSTNGCIVNGVARAEVDLASGDLVQLGATIVKFLDGANVETLYHEEIYKLTITDGLTGIPNKRYLLEYLEREVSRVRRYERPLCLLMFDIDHFKRINDTLGHLAGDTVLRELAETVRRHLRAEELFARYGGEEFVVVMPETQLPGAVTVAEKIRVLVERSPLSYGGVPVPITISIGVAGFSASMPDIAAFIQAVDAKLYQAKNQGRNRVCF